MFTEQCNPLPTNVENRFNSPNDASKRQMGYNLALKWLTILSYDSCSHPAVHILKFDFHGEE